MPGEDPWSWSTSSWPVRVGVVSFFVVVAWLVLLVIGVVTIAFLRWAGVL